MFPDVAGASAPSLPVPAVAAGAAEDSATRKGEHTIDGWQCRGGEGGGTAHTGNRRGGGGGGNAHAHADHKILLQRGGDDLDRLAKLG